MFVLIALTKAGREIFRSILQQTKTAERFLVDTTLTAGPSIREHLLKSLQSSRRSATPRKFGFQVADGLPYKKPYIEPEFKRAEQAVADENNSLDLGEALKNWAVKYKQMGCEKLILSELDFLFESALVKPLEEQDSIIYISISMAYDALDLHDNAIVVLSKGLEKLMEASDIYSRAAVVSDLCLKVAEELQLELFSLEKHISKRDESFSRTKI